MKRLVIILLLFSVSIVVSVTSFAKQTATDRVFSQKLNHFDSKDLRRFKQRYHFDSSFSRGKDSPVLFYSCGESACSKRVLMKAGIQEYAKALGAHIVALEHRYYGKSIPFKKLSTKNLLYLSIDQAVEDLFTFQNYAEKKYSFNGSWTVLGASYPGTLAAYYRITHPEKVIGAVASSAPVLADNYFDEYDTHIFEVIGSQCLGLVQDTVKKIELSINNPKEMKGWKKAFSAEEVDENVDFLYFIAEVLAASVQYGRSKEFCYTLVSNPEKGYSFMAEDILSMFRMSAEDFTPQGSLSEAPQKGIGMRAWFYQSCTEFGFWQIAPRINSSRSSLINIDYHKNICKRLFGLNKIANTDRINNLLYKQLVQGKASRILFTNGSEDPWKTLSFNFDIPKREIFSLAIRTAAHGDDLGARRASNQVKEARKMTIKLLKNWLNN